MSNPFAALIDDNNKSPSRKSPISSLKDDELCDQLQSIFGFTLDNVKITNQKYVYLEDQPSMFPGRSLDVEILEHALFERLFLQTPIDCVIDKEHVDTCEEYYEPKVITYLYYCFKRNYGTTIAGGTGDSVQNLILRNVLTGLKQPELYSGQNLYEQFVEILKECWTLYEEFFDAVFNAFVQDEDGLGAMKDPYRNILKVIHMDVAKYKILSLLPNTMDTIKLFTTNEHLGDIFIDYCKPTKPNIGLEYANTLLGALLSVSILPKTQSGTYDYFQNPLDQASNASVENMLHTNMNALIQFIHNLLLSLLKCSPNVRSKTLSWLGECLRTNADRGKLWNAQVPDLMSPSTVSDGFMLNFCAVMLQLCQPFCEPAAMKKILKVDPTYCSVVSANCETKGIHLLNMSTETCLIPGDDEQNLELLSSPTYNFLTECFYMGHKSIDLGYKVLIDKLVRLSQDMARIERAYNDALNQAHGGNEIVDTIKQRMSSEMGRYLSMKTALSEPQLLKSLYNLTTASCFWFNQVSVNLPKHNGEVCSPILVQKDIHFPLKEDIPETLKCIPEFIVENIVSYLVFLRRFNPKLYEVHGYEQMKSILTFIVIYMGSPKRMKNPHLRARLAEALEALLPFHKDEPTTLNMLGGYQRQMLFNLHEHREEIVRSLLEVFVGIEMTGQSVQFEQKFNYRRPMYIVMDYLWELPEHQQYFIQLAQEAEKNMEAVNPPLFLRFINLLMNDAVFLLDDALSNMSKLKDMQIARENGDWDRLSSQERAQNMGYMQHIGMLAKFDNILGRDTIKTLERLTSKISIVFTHSTMVDRVAAMLNYFLLNLVGPNQKNFKVKDQKEYSFDPAASVLDICKIYVNLKNCESFCLAISQDGRSYSPQLFTLAQDVLIRIGGGSLIGELQEVASMVAEKAIEYQASEEVVAEAPEHFLDPIMSTLMTDPVILPSSKQTVDRTTIARHLLSDQTDPFNRSPLTMDQIIPNTELATEIRTWLEDKKAGPSK